MNQNLKRTLGTVALLTATLAFGGSAFALSANCGVQMYDMDGPAFTAEKTVNDFQQSIGAGAPGRFSVTIDEKENVLTVNSLSRKAGVGPLMETLLQPRS